MRIFLLTLIAAAIYVTWFQLVPMLMSSGNVFAMVLGFVLVAAPVAWASDELLRFWRKKNER